MSWFMIHSKNLCLSIGVFRLLLFKVILDVVGLTSTIFVTISYLLSLFSFLSFFLFLHFVFVFGHIIPYSLLS